MGCKPCQAAADARNAAKAYVYTDENGISTTKQTEVEAYAMKIHNGNKGTVRPA